MFRREILAFVAVSALLGLFCSPARSAPFVEPAEVRRVIESARPDSPLKDRATAFVIYGLAYDVDPRLMVAISAAESTYGTDPCPRLWPDPEGRHNGWGWFWNGGGTCANSPVYSWDGAIRGSTKNVKHKIFGEQRVSRLDEFDGIYCTSGCEHWLRNACAALSRFSDTRGFCDETNHTSASYAGYRFDFHPGELIFTSDVDSGVTGWEGSGFWHVQESPDRVRVSPDINGRLVMLGPRLRDAQLDLTYRPGFLAPAYSGSKVWWYGEESTGTYIGSDFRSLPQLPNNGGTSTRPNGGDLITPTIDLTRYRHAFLTFFTLWEIESVDANTFDLLSEAVRVEVSAGGSFEHVGVLNPTRDVNGPPHIPYVSSYIDIFDAFSNVEPRTPLWRADGADLSKFVGKRIKVRFRFATGDTIYNGFRGWMIDDIKVFGIP